MTISHTIWLAIACGLAALAGRAIVRAIARTRRHRKEHTR